jgi:hypothetical protein
MRVSFDVQYVLDALPAISIYSGFRDRQDRGVSAPHCPSIPSISIFDFAMFKSMVVLAAETPSLAAGPGLVSGRATEMSGFSICLRLSGC